MGRSLNRIVVIDVESTCWEKQTYQKNEIIEIGITELAFSTNFYIKDNRSIYIKPIHSEVSEFCTKLTGITEQILNENGGYPPEVFDSLYKEYGKNNIIWASYGDYDREMFRRMSLLYDIKYPLGRTHLNVKTLFALSSNLNQEVGLAEAISILGNTFHGIHHSGKDDSYNIAILLINLLKKIGK